MVILFTQPLPCLFSIMIYGKRFIVYKNVEIRSLTRVRGFPLLLMDVGYPYTETKTTYLENLENVLGSALVIGNVIVRSLK